MRYLLDTAKGRAPIYIYTYIYICGIHPWNASQPPLAIWHTPSTTIRTRGRVSGRIGGFPWKPAQKTKTLNPWNPSMSSPKLTDHKDTYCGWTKSCTTSKSWLKPSRFLVFTKRTRGGSGSHRASFQREWISQPLARVVSQAQKLERLPASASLGAQSPGKKLDQNSMPEMRGTFFKIFCTQRWLCARASKRINPQTSPFGTLSQCSFGRVFKPLPSIQENEIARTVFVGQLSMALD